MSVEAKKLIDLTRLSRFKELMDQSVDGKLSRLKLDLVQVVSGLPDIDAAEEGVLYLVPTETDGEYDLYAKETVDGVAKLVKNSSISLSGNLDDFLLKADAEEKYISTASVADDTITLSRPDGSTVVITVNNVEHATKADQDGNGDVIADTYETKADAEEKYISTATSEDDTITLSRPDGSTVVITIDNVGHATKADQDGNGYVIADTYETKADAQATYQKADDITLATTEDVDALFA